MANKSSWPTNTPNFCPSEKATLLWREEVVYKQWYWIITAIILVMRGHSQFPTVTDVQTCDKALFISLLRIHLQFAIVPIRYDYISYVYVLLLLCRIGNYILFAVQFRSCSNCLLLGKTLIITLAKLNNQHFDENKHILYRLCLGTTQWWSRRNITGTRQM